MNFCDPIPAPPTAKSATDEVKASRTGCKDTACISRKSYQVDG
jgi:hypothetical protein